MYFLVHGALMSSAHALPGLSAADDAAIMSVRWTHKSAFHESSQMPRLPDPDRLWKLKAITTSLARGAKLATACRETGVSQATYFRWCAAEGWASPREAERRRLRSMIIDAAKAVFLRDGYSASLGQIADAAGVARQTLYNQFGSKEQLFREVVRAVFERMLRPILQLDRDGDTRATLKAYALQYLEVAFDPEGIALHRLAISEQREFPELPAIVFGMGAAQADSVLAAYLQAGIDAGRIAPVDAALAAESFLGSLVGHGRSWAMAGVSFRSRERRRELAELAVEVFVSGLQRGATPCNGKRSVAK